MIDMATIKQSLLASQRRIEEQINVIKEEAKTQNLNPYEMRYRDGRYMLSELIVAQANVTTALYNWLDNEAHTFIRLKSKEENLSESEMDEIIEKINSYYTPELLKRWRDG